MITVDNREQKLHEYLSTILDAPIAVKPLDVADVEIRLQNDESEEAIFLFERKSHADIMASIKDGRYHDQKARMLSVTPPHRITYILETAGMTLAPPEEGAIFNTMYRDGMHVVLVKDTLETAMWIARTFQKLQRNPALFTSNNREQKPSSLCMKSKRRDNITPSICYRMMLSQIPGISSKIAEEISKKYDSMPRLIEALQGSQVESMPLVGKKKLDSLRLYLGIRL